MSTSYNAQLDNVKEEYRIQFQTNDYEKFKFVESACQKAVDKNNKEFKTSVTERMPEQEFVHCKDCMYCKLDNCNQTVCTFTSDYYVVTNTDFCSNGRFDYISN